MSTNPLITIVTPSYNQVNYLEACIDSVLSQNYSNLEYIVMDGGSTDGSVEIIKKYEKHLTYWQSKKDKGHYWAVNEGFKMGSGEIMGWINSDDMLHEKGLSSIAEVFNAYSDIEFVTGRRRGFDGNGKIKFHDEFYAQRFWREFLLDPKTSNQYGLFVMQEGTYWKRTLWEKAGAYIAFEYKYAADYELWLRFMRYAPLYSVNSDFGGFRSHSEHQRSSENFQDYLDEVIKIIEKEKLIFVNNAWTNSPKPLLKKPYKKIESPPIGVKEFSENEIENFSAKAKNPDIAIVIVNHSKSSFAKESLNSIFKQANCNFECVLIDTCPSSNFDSIQNYLAYYEKNIDLSIPEATLVGLNKTTAPIMSILLSDDELNENSLSEVKNIFLKNPAAKLITGIPYAIDENSEILWTLSKIPIFSRDRYIFTDFERPRMHMSGVFWKRELWEKIEKTFDTKQEHAYTFDLTRKLLRYEIMHPTKEFLAGKRESPDYWPDMLYLHYKKDSEKLIEEEVELFKNGTFPFLEEPKTVIFS